jgi:hypothetical protein
MKQLSCEQCRERWDELIDKSTFEAIPPELATVRAHLENCAACRKTFDLRIAARHELQHLPAQKAPASLRGNILRQIETPEKPSVFGQPWLASLFTSPRRLAWASGAIMTVFVVALLMRPERQQQILQPAPEVLSSSAQKKAPADFPPPQPAAPPKSKKTASTPKVLSTKPHHATSGNSVPAIPPRQKIPTATGKSTRLIAPAPKTVPDKTTPMATRDTGTGEPAAPPAAVLPHPDARINEDAQPQNFALRAPVNNDSASPQPKGDKTTATAKYSARNAEIQADSANRSMGQSAPAPGFAGESMPTFKSQTVRKTISWTKTIASDYDVSNAEIVITLKKGLAFEDSSASTQTLWRGMLSRGKQIPLHLNLLRDSDQTGKLQLKMIDTDTRKVLLDKEFEVK